MSNTRRSVAPHATVADLAQSYISLKESFDPLKKQVDDCGKKLKSAMRDVDLTEYVVGDKKVTISVTPKSDFNELQAIEILRKNLTPEQFAKCVKTKEYIDDDALESMVFNREVDAAILAPAETPKEPTVTLRVSKAKK